MGTIKNILISEKLKKQNWQNLYFLISLENHIKKLNFGKFAKFNSIVDFEAIHNGSGPRSLGSCCIKGTGESMTRVDVLVSLMHIDLCDPQSDHPEGIGPR